MVDYVQAARAESDVDLQVLFKQYVLDPHGEDFAHGYYSPSAWGRKVEYIQDLDKLKKAVDILGRSDVESIVKKALQNVSQLLPGPDITVYIFACNPDFTFGRDHMNGVVGRTHGPGKFILEIYPEGNWLDWVLYMVAHEYHHIAFKDVYEENTPKPLYLAYIILLEGRADSFARFVYPNMIAPWTTALTPEQELNIWQNMKNLLKNTSPQLFRKYLFGGYEGIPYWAGYTVGYHIVQKFLANNPEIGVIEWTKMDSLRLLQESNYDGYYKKN